MTLAAELGAARLTVLLDVRHPLAYLALHPTLALAEETSVTVDWLPLPTPPLNPPSPPGPDDDRGVRHRRYRAEAIARGIETYARAQGLVIRDYYRSGEADAANLGWLWMRDRHRDRLEPWLVELFRAYFALELDPSSADRVASLIEQQGGDRAAFLAWAAGDGPAVAAAVDAEIRGHGIGQVPAYLVDDEVFYGRQHLPMIRWILEGRVGPGPI